MSPELGYPVVRELLARKQPFTALVAFNDLTAIGAMRALRESGVRVPDDVSVIGFDDIEAAAFHNPSLTTIRQPMHEMGRTAARILIERLEQKKTHPDEIALAPELVVRESTQPPPPEPRVGKRAVK